MIKLSLLAARMLIQVELIEFRTTNYFYVFFFQFHLKGADGKRYRVKYTADEFGYHPITALDDFEIPE